MQPTKSHLTKRLAAIAVLLIASAVLVACGGSSSTTGSTSTTNAAATAPTGSGRARFSALRECLQKEGITLPTRPQGGKPSGGKPGGGLFLGGGGQRTLPSGVSRSKFEAAIKKCGGGGSFQRFGDRNRLNNANFKKSLEKFATCMRQNGVNVPAPNTTGKGPIFDTKGIDTGSAKFRTAQQKCSSLLGFARPGGAGAAGAPAGAPGAPGGPAPAQAG